MWISGRKVINCYLLGVAEGLTGTVPLTGTADPLRDYFEQKRIAFHAFPKALLVVL